MRSGDHPRSRGVYSTVRAARNAASGSSPLARGLRGAGDRAGSGGRIIPARAGFTLPRRQGRRRRADHPRSRGVYAARARALRTVQGSSPLARGLQVLDDRPALDGGIIPARAGFTPGCRRTRSHRQDHPRSRGVYVASARAVASSGGSSPLARGLRRQGGEQAAHGRIIPARAGFTRRRPGAPPSRTDHPRSRGVYPGASRAAARARGSSPLARGLQGDLQVLGQGPGIIPARAGFTPVPGLATLTGRDHPRSRGVYTVSAIASIS